jgi:hypothetical protein
MDRIISTVSPDNPHYVVGWIKREGKRQVSNPRQKRWFLADGNKRIYCNFYCGKESLSCKPISVKDGGDCFFRVEYDIKDTTIYNLMINGEA